MNYAKRIKSIINETGDVQALKAIIKACRKRIKEVKKVRVSLNEEQRLYVIAYGDGYSCLGYDVCEQRTNAIAAWLGVQVSATKGTVVAYEVYEAVCKQAAKKNALTGERCPAELTPQLNGLEGKLVEVKDKYGEVRTFKVGKSTGWMPCHLEIEKGEDGGPSVTGAPFEYVKVLGK